MTIEAVDTIPTTTAATAAQKFKFTGTGGEYFRIWIVNLLLSILTLGIYSAWAKVRRNQYYYSSTHVAGSSFEYHGNPIAILKGRIIAVVLLVCYQVALKSSPVSALIAILVMVSVLPWLIWKSMQFKLYNTSYRGIRFGFDGSIGKAYFNFLLMPLVGLFSAYLLAPLAHHQIKNFQHTESRFGKTNFSFNASIGSFYITYLICLGLALAGFAVVGALFGSSIYAMIQNISNLAAGISMIIVAIIIMYVWTFFVFAIGYTLLQNLVWNNTQLATHRFESTLHWGQLIFIGVTNLIGIVFTIGLFIPFAQIRMMKYRVESMTLIPDGSLDDFVAETESQVGAAGEGVADLLDFDISM